MKVPAFADIGKQAAGACMQYLNQFLVRPSCRLLLSHPPTTLADLLYGAKTTGIFQYDQKVTINMKSAEGVVRSAAL
jgi:hypothetical protein